MWKRIISDKQVHEFLFKYAAIILAFGVSTVIGAVNTLAPLEDKVYERYYKAKAEVELRDNRVSLTNEPETSPAKSPEKYNEGELLLRARSELTSAEHSKKLISSLANMNQAIFEFCRIMFFLLLVLASGHWLMYKASGEETQTGG
jgi:hypothetical protein